MAGDGGCPVCRFAHASGQRYLEGIIYDSVNDVGLRQELERGLGFCGRHSRAMLDIAGARLGAAILEQAMLREALRRLEHRSFARRGLINRRAEAAPMPGDRCPVCAQEQAAARRALEDLLAHWHDDWAEALENSGGLCYNHLHQALALASDPAVRDQLKGIHQRLWRQLVDQLDAFIRKHDYRFRGEAILDEESRAIVRAMAALTGEDPTF